MRLGRVVGCVWSTAKHPGLQGQRLLVVQPVTPTLEASGKRLVCADCTGAGAGEIVYWCSGKEASFPFLPNEIPVDTTIVGIVDSVRFQPPARSNTDVARARKISRKG
jgi:ethanolamine utilization protein EutN